MGSCPQLRLLIDCFFVIEEIHDNQIQIYTVACRSTLLTSDGKVQKSMQQILVHLIYNSRKPQRPHKAKNMEVDHDNARGDQVVQ